MIRCTVAYLLNGVNVRTEREGGWKTHLTFPTLGMVALTLSRFSSVTPSSVEFNAFSALQSGKQSYTALIYCANEQD